MSLEGTYCTWVKVYPIILLPVTYEWKFCVLGRVSTWDDHYHFISSLPNSPSKQILYTKAYDVLCEKGKLQPFHHCCHHPSNRKENKLSDRWVWLLSSAATADSPLIACTVTSTCLQACIYKFAVQAQLCGHRP